MVPPFLTLLVLLFHLSATHRIELDFPSTSQHQSCSKNCHHHSHQKNPIPNNPIYSEKSSSYLTYSSVPLTKQNDLIYVDGSKQRDVFIIPPSFGPLRSRLEGIKERIGCKCGKCAECRKKSFKKGDKHKKMKKQTGWKEKYSIKNSELEQQSESESYKDCGGCGSCERCQKRKE